METEAEDLNEAGGRRYLSVEVLLSLLLLDLQGEAGAQDPLERQTQQ